MSADQFVVNFRYAEINATTARYWPDQRQQGWNTTADGERFYFIPTPSVGLWATREMLFNRASGVQESSWPATNVGTMAAQSRGLVHFSANRHRPCHDTVDRKHGPDP